LTNTVEVDFKELRGSGSFALSCCQAHMALTREGKDKYCNEQQQHITGMPFYPQCIGIGIVF